MIELVQGPCRENQISLVNAKVIDCAREYIASYESPHELNKLGLADSAEDISNIKNAVITLLVSLLEGEINLDIITRMAKGLDFSTLKDRVTEIFHLFAIDVLREREDLAFADIPLAKLTNMLLANAFDSIIKEAFEIYNLLQTLADTVPMAAEELERIAMTKD